MTKLLLLILVASVIPFSQAWAEEDYEAESEAGVSEKIRYRSESPLNMGLDLQYVPVHYPRYTWGEGLSSPKGGHGAHLGLEWLPLGDLYGKLGVGLGLGLYAIRNVDFAEQRASLTTVPVESYLAYRFDYFHNQILVPFAKVGVSATLARQQGIEVPWRTYGGFDYSGGLQLCLNSLDPTSAIVFDNSMGVNASYLVFEYLRSQPLGAPGSLDLSHDEYRLGLRIEM